MEPQHGDISPQLRILAEQLLNGELDEQAIIELEAEILGNPVAQDFFWAHCQLHVDLSLDAGAERAFEAVLASQASALTKEENVVVAMSTLAAPPRPSAGVGSRLAETIHWQRHKIRFNAMSAVLTALAWIGFSYFVWYSATPDGFRPNRTGSIQYVAEITGQHEHQWAEGMPLMSVRHALLSGERLNLAEGLIEITFDGGAVVVLEGPTDFVVDSPGAGTLDRGRLLAKVPEEAVGFTVETPTGRVVDLGTQFGVWVDESGDAEVHVFDGEVEAILLNLSGREVQRISLVKDQAARIGPDDVAVVQIVAELEPFEQLLAVEPGLRPPVELARGLVAYYPLDGNPHDLSVNANHMTENGEGIGYTMGRVGQALRLDQSESPQWLSVTGTNLFGNSGLTTSDTSTNTYSWQAWVHPIADVIGSDDYILSTTLSTVPGYGFAMAGRIDTSERLDVYKQHVVGDGSWANIDNPLRGVRSAAVDGWYHILVTFDATHGVNVYVNGALDNGTESGVNGGVELEAAMAFDGLNIGADQNIGPGRHKPNRFFDGQIDEVAIWNRVLTASEIASLFNNGNGASLVD